MGWVLKDMSLEEMWQRVTAANPYWVGVTVVIALLSHVSRAYRWNLLLEPLGYKPGIKNTTIAVLSGYFGNIFVPRGGEVVRCMVLNRTNKIPVTTGFATVIAERAFDLLCLFILIFFSFVVEYKRFWALIDKMKEVKKTSAKSLGNSFEFYAFIGMGMITLLLFIYILRRSMFMRKVKEFLMKLISEAILSFKSLKRRNEFLLHTAIIWIGYFLMTYLIFFSLPSTSHLGPLAGLVILIIGGLGMSAPASGGIGAFHIMVANGLTLFYGLSSKDGITYAFVLHTSQLFTIFFFGGLSLIVSFFINPDSEKNNSV